LETKKILITGGSGFIRQNIAKKFVENGQDVCIFDVRPPGSLYGEYLKGDIFDSEKLRDIVKKCDVVIHLVGLADAGIAQREPEKSFRLNVMSLQNVLEACRINGNKKLIFPSSAAVYGVRIHKYSIFRNLGYKELSLPNTEELSSQVLTLPMYFQLDRCDMDYTISNIKEFFGLNKQMKKKETKREDEALRNLWRRTNNE